MNNGPNYIWHMDGYDKLKPYGICIHGCIDGFSRNIMWLEADTTNKDPYVIAGYFIDTVREVGGCSRCIRADLGTENGIVRELQVALRDCDGHETNAFLYGTSECNQRIESWWNILRKESAHFWMDMFQTIKDDGHFSGGFLDVNLIRFCFMNLIQDELKIVVRTWNSHKLRSMKNVMTPCGRPDLLYNLPELCGTDN
ncbi:unnamed protein product [Mytilus coruscus]|uniref:Integrase core domain-containing protein n=1 Tax=Mytilus coruscus TaxID=42192 RepID=A0A6J8F046_MYTCO|nr:unnamed protein product [Mytilus coruscus]